MEKNASHLKKGIDHTGIAVVYFCHDGKGNIVMAQRNENARDEHGCFDIGGGAVEFGDTVENTLRQEINQEYGTDVLQFEFLGYRDVHRQYDDSTKTHWIALDFKVLVDPKKVINGEPHKFTQVAWFTLNNLPSKVHSQLPYFLDKYKERL